jgi:hypothetical protein
VNDIVIFEGLALTDLLERLQDLDAADVYRLRVCVDGGFKIKVNEGTWTPPLGVLV